MKSLREFFLDHVGYFANMVAQVSGTHDVRESARRSILHFVEDLKARMERRIDEIEPDTVAETVVGWFAHLSAAVPSAEDEKGIPDSSEAPPNGEMNAVGLDEAGASAEPEFRFDFGPIHIDTRPPRPIPPRPYPPPRPHDRRDRPLPGPPDHDTPPHGRRPGPPGPPPGPSPGPRRR